LEKSSKSKARCSRIDRNEAREISFRRDRVAVIETNVDDVTGEILSQAVERLLSEGAFDCTLLPFVGKKGRPGFTVRVICSTHITQKLAQILVMETGTMGVKIFRTDRWIVNRRLVQIPFNIASFHGKVSLKVLETSAGIFRVKPEAEQMREISRITGFPMREIEDKVKAKAEDLLFRKQSS
jgi:pyridinium-3,5-bisthiocarboxylic acid mononucleotide nickel chelatase